jgi:TPP-dependent trihydroxycyclohexane-1,2-dione (THcHDO) dehydratase
MVSNKFLRFLTEKGIPVTDTQTGQAVVVLEHKDQLQSQGMTSSSKVLRNSHLQDVMMAANQ